MTDTQEDRYVLGIAHQAGPDPAIKMGADGGRDYFTARELELASRTFLRKGGMRIGFNHMDGTDSGFAEVVESYIYRGPDWAQADGTVVKAGDWLLGAILSEKAWALYKAGYITGWSIQGSARRVTPGSEA